MFENKLASALVSAALLVACDGGQDAAGTRDARVEAQDGGAAASDAALQDGASLPVQDAGDDFGPDLDAGPGDVDAAVGDASTGEAAVDAAGAEAALLVSYSMEIQPIFDAYCIACHRRGGEAPFSLETFEAAFPRGASAYIAARSRTMPPCAETDESCGPTEEELATLGLWVEQGRPHDP